jgi:1-phosphofructokinase
MITTVTLNPAIDRTITLEHFVYGSVNRSQSVREDMGGKGINVAKVLNALGTEARAIGFIGKDNAGSVEALLKSENLKTDFIAVPGKTRTNMKMIETSTRVTTDINEAGFLVSEDHISTMKKLIRNYARKSEYLVFSGSVPSGAGITLYQELMESVSDMRGLRVALDAENDLLLSGLKARPFVIKPNLYELESALNRKMDTPEKIVAAARELIREFGVGTVLISMGGEGSFLVTGEQAFYAKALKVDVKGTVGAGDSMLAGYLFGLSEEFEQKKALAWATVCGALAVSKEGTQSFKRADAEPLLADVEIQEYR